MYPGSPDLDASTMTEAQKKSIGLIDNGQVLLYGKEPTEDTRTAWTIPVSAGFEGSLGASYGLDFRVRYNLIFGEVNPLTAWGMHKAFPIRDSGCRCEFQILFRVMSDSVFHHGRAWETGLYPLTIFYGGS